MRVSPWYSSLCGTFLATGGLKPTVSSAKAGATRNIARTRRRRDMGAPWRVGEGPDRVAGPGRRRQCVAGLLVDGFVSFPLSHPPESFPNEFRNDFGFRSRFVSATPLTAFGGWATLVERCESLCFHWYF